MPNYCAHRACRTTAPCRYESLRPTPRELAAIDAIHAAYMACNHADESETTGKVSPLAYEYSVGYPNYPASAMGYLAEAGRDAWDRLGLPGRKLWELMSTTGEDAEYVFGIYVRDIAE